MKDPFANDRTLAHELKQYPDDNETETEFKALSDELEELNAHLDGLKQRKKNI